MKNKYLVKALIKYSILLVALVCATNIVYNAGKKSYTNYLNNNKDNEKWLENNIKLVENYRIGSGVLTVEMPSNLDVDVKKYNREVSKEINKLLINSYKIEDPLFIYDPFKLDSSSVNIYFHTGEKYKFEYMVTTDSISLIDDSAYKRIKDSDNEDVMNTKHFYVIKDFKCGKKNNLIIRILDENDEVIETENFILNIPKEKKH